MTRRTATTETAILQTVTLQTVVLLMVAVFRIGAQPVSLSPKTMSRIGTVDERFQSYNIEMVEVTGGRFWKPYNREPGERE